MRLLVDILIVKILSYAVLWKNRIKITNYGQDLHTYIYMCVCVCVCNGIIITVKKAMFEDSFFWNVKCVG